MKSQIDETLKRRSFSRKELNEWENACAQFHDEYDGLAFPGGLSIGIKKIKEGHIPSIESALDYLENTPYCYRSQYVATDLKRALNKVDLPDRLAKRFYDYKRSKH